MRLTAGRIISNVTFHYIGAYAYDITLNRFNPDVNGYPYIFSTCVLGRYQLRSISSGYLLVF